MSPVGDTWCVGRGGGAVGGRGMAGAGGCDTYLYAPAVSFGLGEIVHVETVTENTRA